MVHMLATESHLSYKAVQSITHSVIKSVTHIITNLETCPGRACCVQVCNPLDLIAKISAGSTAPNLPMLRRLVKCLTSIVSMATLLEQAQLESTVQEMLAFLPTWFDFEERSCIGILQAGNKAQELDVLKEQYSALPALLQQVRTGAQQRCSVEPRITAFVPHLHMLRQEQSKGHQ
jgi:hypothetical protein